MIRARRGWRQGLVIALVAGAPVAASPAAAQETTETLVRGEVDHSLHVAPTTKFTSIDGRFGNLTGLTIGVALDERFLIGVSGLGMTNRTSEIEMGYGGLHLEYFHRPRKLVHWSVGGLIGGGEVTSFAGFRSATLVVVEPEGTVTLNVTKRLRLGFGAGYRFVGNAARTGLDLSGATGSFRVSFGFFQD